MNKKQTDKTDRKNEYTNSLNKNIFANKQFQQTRTTMAAFLDFCPKDQRGRNEKK